MTLYHLTILLVKADFTLILDQTSGYQEANITIYQQLIGKLIYLSYGTCPNIAFIVSQLSYHNSNL